jgi:hypothetical protein
VHSDSESTLLPSSHAPFFYAYARQSQAIVFVARISLPLFAVQFQVLCIANLGAVLIDAAGGDRHPSASSHARKILYQKRERFPTYHPPSTLPGISIFIMSVYVYRY